MTNSTYKTIVTTETVTKTQYEATCSNCGKVWTLPHPPRPPFVCAVCEEVKNEAAFQESYKHLINGRITAIVSDDSSYSRNIKSLVICDEDGDYWKIEAGSDGDYGHIIEVEACEDCGEETS